MGKILSVIGAVALTAGAAAAILSQFYDVTINVESKPKKADEEAPAAKDIVEEVKEEAAEVAEAVSDAVEEAKDVVEEVVEEVKEAVEEPAE